MKKFFDMRCNTKIVPMVRFVDPLTREATRFESGSLKISILHDTNGLLLFCCTKLYEKVTNTYVQFIFMWCRVQQLVNVSILFVNIAHVRDC